MESSPFNTFTIIQMPVGNIYLMKKNFETGNSNVWGRMLSTLQVILPEIQIVMCPLKVIILIL